jgi:hypothetical protein
MDPSTMLLVVDVQLAIDDQRWKMHGPRNNPGADAKVAELLAGWRCQARPIINLSARQPRACVQTGGHARCG